ncbi:MAG: OmpA family protein [Lewinellaceae bacterium]|nr:OmpA family protein [Lewinellaceae bacterium]
MSLLAQDAPAFRSFTQKDKVELGLDLGVPFIVGDLDANAGFGAGLHLRKALDHTFSVRLGGLYTSATNGSGDHKSETTTIGGGVDFVAALNNLRYDKPNRKVLLNTFVGVGGMSAKADHDGANVLDATLGYLDFGAGLAFRISPKFNIGLDYTVYSPLGGNADYLDGDGANSSKFRDNLHFPHLSLNLNLGSADKTEPLYWVNPMVEVGNAISALEARPIYDPTDTDGDGIIDAIDDEDNSPAGARVDSRGVTLDSDGDKVPDYKDKEPFSPPGYAVDANGVANVPKPNWVTEADVNRIVDAKLAAFKLPTKGVTNWFLPMVNFDLNNYTVKRAEYETMYQVAMVVKSNPDLKFVVTGNADRSGSEAYNGVLSYNRAKSAIEFLVNQHGVSRDQLLLNYSGEGNAIIDTNAANYTNRRVEFRVAKDGDKNMDRPEGKDAGTGRFQGNKSGY